MRIHNSHSRKELFDIISVFELPITNRNEYNKAQIQMKIIECLDYFDKINPDMDYFFCETIKEKDEVMSRSKKILGYCRNNYYLMPSSYVSFDDVYNDAVYISKHGGIPSVRKAIEALNKDPKLAYPIELKIPKRVENQIKKKRKAKQSAVPLFIKRGRIIVRFD